MKFTAYGASSEFNPFVSLDPNSFKLYLEVADSRLYLNEDDIDSDDIVSVDGVGNSRSFKVNVSGTYKVFKVKMVPVDL